MNEALPLDFIVEIKSEASFVDVTDHIDLNASQPVITSALDSELDTLTLTVDDGDSLDLHPWQEIRVWDLHYVGEVSSPVIIFGGYIVTIDPSEASNRTKNQYVLGCSDYGALLEKSYVQAEYLNKTDKQIIAAIFAAADPDVSEFNVSSSVDTLATLPKERYNRLSVKEVLDSLCDRSGGHRYVDYWKFLHYFATEADAAPWNVSDDPLEDGCQVVEDIQQHLDGTDVVNVVEIVGGNFLSADQVDYYPGTGFKNTLNLVSRTKPPAGETKILVRRNDGGPTTNLEVNPSFEVNITDGNTQTQGGTGAAWDLSTAKYYSGTKCLRITAGTAAARVYGSSISVAPGEAISMQCMAWCSVLGKARISVVNASTGASLVNCVNRKASTWELLTVTYVNTSNASISLRRDLINLGTDSATMTYFDAVQTEKLSWPTAYCDGSLGTGYAWTGTANNSTSTRVAMAVWTDLTVKTGNNDTLAARNEVLFFETKAYLQQENYLPDLKNALEVTGQHETPMRVQCQNDASYDHYGRWMKVVITDTSILDKAVGILRARTELAKSAFDSVSLDYKTRSAGLRSGMLQRIDHTARNIHGSYVIQTVTTTIGIGGHVESQVSLGAANMTLVKYLLRLKRKTKPVLDWDDTEVLDVILENSETLTLNAITPVLTVNETPYLWGAVRWGLGAWE